MSQSVVWPPIGGASYSVPEASEEDWAALTNYLVALSGAQSTTAQKWGTRTAVTTPVTVSSAGDCLVGVKLTVPAAATVNLPVGVVGQVFVIADQEGDAATNNITVMPNGSQTIAAASSYVININRGAVGLVFTGAGNWSVIFQSTTGGGGGGTVARADVAAGTPGFAIFNDGTTGLLSEEAFVSAVRGGLGANASAFTGYLKATAGVFSASAIAAADLPTAIDAAKIGDGSVSTAEFQFINSLTSNAQTQIDTKVTGQASSVDNEIALFSGTTGKLIKRATGTGIAVMTSGVLASATFDNITPSQTGNAGKYLQTNGSVTSWQTAVGGYTVSQVTANPSPAVDNTLYAANTNGGAFSITLPTLVVGAKIKIQDAIGTWATNNLTIVPATGEKIYPLAINETLVCNVTRGWIELIGVTGGWSPTSLASTSLGGGSGLTGVSATGATTAVNGIMYECDTTAAGFTLTLPGGTSAAVVGILDAGPFFATNNLIVAPATGGFIDTGAVNDTLTIDVNRANVIFYRANGSNTWEIQSSGMTSYAAGFTPGYTGGVAIGAGNIGETLTSSTPGSTAVNGTGTVFQVQSLLVTPGVWVIYSHLIFSTSGAASTTIVNNRCETSTSTTAYVDNESTNFFSDSTQVLAGCRGAAFPLYVNLSVSTTFYLLASMALSAGTTPSAYNVNSRIMRAVRIA